MLDKFDGLPSLFANVQRLAVAEHVLGYAVVPPAPFTANDVVKRFDGYLAPHAVGSALRAMEDLGMIAEQASPSYDRRKHLICDARHPFWSIVGAAVDAVVAGEA